LVFGGSEVSLRGGMGRRKSGGANGTKNNKTAPFSGYFEETDNFECFWERRKAQD
jgi:hypothetical protein